MLIIIGYARAKHLGSRGTYFIVLDMPGHED